MLRKENIISSVPLIKDMLNKAIDLTLSLTGNNVKHATAEEENLQRELKTTPPVIPTKISN